MAVTKAVIETGLRRTLGIMYRTPTPSLQMGTLWLRVLQQLPQSPTAGGRNLAGGKGKEEMHSENVEGGGRSDPFVLSYLPGLPCLHLPCWAGAGAWEQRLGPAALPVGMGSGCRTPSVPAALASASRPEETRLPGPSMWLLVT